MPVLELYTVYERPVDLPGCPFVVRLWAIEQSSGEAVPVPTPVFWVAGSLEDARALLPAGLVCLARSEGDDPAVVETWL